MKIFINPGICPVWMVGLSMKNTESPKRIS